MLYSQLSHFKKLLVLALTLTLLLSFGISLTQAKTIKANQKQCDAVKEAFYMDLAKDKSEAPAKRELSKTKTTSNKNGLDQEVIAYCKKKYAKSWKAIPSKKVCDLIARYERQKQLTKMIAKNKASWVNFYYCRAKAKGRL